MCVPLSEPALLRLWFLRLVLLHTYDLSLRSTHGT